MKTWRSTILAQFWDSPILTALIGSIEEWISPDKFYEQFYDDIWNVLTATGYGLDVWGRIVNVGRVVQVPAPTGYFGFGGAGDRTGFGQSPFYTVPVSQNVTLTDTIYRQLILAKAAYNITDGSIGAINAILMNLFPNRGNAYVTDGRNLQTSKVFGFGGAGDRQPFGQGTFMGWVAPYPPKMTLTYVFTFPLEPFEVAIVQQSGVLPKPVGVLANWQFTP